MSKTSTARKSASISDDYLDLIREFPLCLLRTAKDHAGAQAILDRLIGREDLTKGQRDYLEGLVRFVEDYEQQRIKHHHEKLTPLDLLKHLLEENDMTTTDLGCVVGSRGVASELLSGKRGFSRMIIAKLAKRFAVDPKLFFDVTLPRE